MALDNKKGGFSAGKISKAQAGVGNMAKAQADAAKLAKAKAEAAKTAKIKADAAKRAMDKAAELKRKAARVSAKPTYRAGAGASIGSGGVIGAGMGMGPTAARAAKIIAEYTVKKGDTLGQIAKNFYGATGPKYWNLIQAANKDLIKDVNLIYPGQVFKIPELPAELKKK